MRRLLPQYDAYLRRRAESVPAAQRQGLARREFFPWFAPTVVVAAAGQLAGIDHRAMIPLVLLSAVIGMAGLGYATSRIASHGWRFDRTPKPQAWLDTDHGRLLLSELQRVSLSGFSHVTPATEIYHDLDIWGAELRDLLSSLAHACGVAALPLPPGPYAPDHRGDWHGWVRTPTRMRGYKSLTVGMLLDAMSQARV